MLEMLRLHYIKRVATRYPLYIVEVDAPQPKGMIIRLIVVQMYKIATGIYLPNVS